MNDLAKLMIVLGLLIALAGALLLIGFGKGWFGRLPGDFHFTRNNFSFYFPLMTCLLISAMLTLILWFFRK
jgi:ribose/xylose/arabinose/galactoside ABC-type transport system permease subunit